MSWLRRSFTVCAPDKLAYYTVLDPVEFYEWRFTGYAPKGHIFSHKLPPSDIFTEGKVVASATISDSDLKPTKLGFALTKDSPVEVKLAIGNMPSPQELIDKYKNMIKSRERGLEAFKQDLITRIYIDSQTDNPHLFRMSHYTDTDVTMHNFGSVEKLIEQFSMIRQALIEESTKKTGRSHEMEEFRRYENAMTFTNNSHLHVDASKMDRLIETSGVKAMQTRTLPWIECYLDVSPGAQQLQSRIKHFENQTWIRSVNSHRV